MITNKNLQFWIENKWNVLFVGKHGVGKTTMVKEAFEKAGLKWKYFSASTMDPWVDFVGVPKEKISEDGVSYLDLVRPEAFARDEIEALFFDEFNRSKEKVRNAVMELIQFKAINGKEFKNLKIVWAAINPYDEEETYDVDRLDPAQEDRFHLKVDIPYRPDRAYFIKKYGIELADPAIQWWGRLAQEHKDLVSPRRLDYAIDIHNNNGDLSYVLDKKVGVKALVDALNAGPIANKLEDLYKNSDDNSIKLFFQNDNNYVRAISSILKKDEYLNKFSPHFPEEKISVLMSEKQNFFEFICTKIEVSPFKEIVENIVESNQNKKIKDKLVDKFPWLSMTVDKYMNTIKMDPNSTVDRRRIFGTIKKSFHKMYRIAGFDISGSGNKQQAVAYLTYKALVDIASRANEATINAEYKELSHIANSAYDLLENCDQVIKNKLEQIARVASAVNKKSFHLNIKVYGEPHNKSDDFDNSFDSILENDVKKEKKYKKIGKYDLKDYGVAEVKPAKLNDVSFEDETLDEDDLFGDFDDGDVPF